MLVQRFIRIFIISPILSLAFFSGVAFGAEQELKLAYQNSLGDIGLKWDSTAATSTNTIVYGNEKIAQPKSEVVALAYAILPGYFIPAAFGHAYAEANVQAAVISSARLSGRIMWMYSF